MLVTNNLPLILSESRTVRPLRCERENTPSVDAGRGGARLLSIFVSNISAVDQDFSEYL